MRGPCAQIEHCTDAHQVKGQVAHVLDAVLHYQWQLLRHTQDDLQANMHVVGTTLPMHCQRIRDITKAMHRNQHSNHPTLLNNICAVRTEFPS